MKAIDTGTSKSLIKNVRLVELGIDTVYWFTVSSNSGSALKTEGTRAGAKQIQGTEQDRPPWAEHATELFPGGDRRCQQEGAGFKRAATAAATYNQLEADERLQVKARRWKARPAFEEI